MGSLIGHLVAIVFDLPNTDWPIQGFPAWGIVVSVDMPLIEIRPQWQDSSLWINATVIKTMRDHGIAKGEA